jgi:hypothetical protein
MNCLVDYIGLRGLCDDVTPASDLFVNDLPGVSLKMLSGVASEEQQSFAGVWEEIQNRSIVMLEADILARMQRFFKTRILLSNSLTGKFRTEYPDYTEASGAFIRGTHIELCYTKNTEVFINWVIIYFDTAHSGNLTIYDTNDGSTLGTVPYVATVGENLIQVNLAKEVYAQRRRIAIGYDGSLSGTQQTNVNSCFCGDNSVAWVRGFEIASGSTVLEDDLTKTGNTHGMLVNFNVTCSINNFVCSNRDFFKTALWYKMGEQLMVERQISERINQFTMVNMDKASELAELYGDKYAENMDSVLKNLQLEGDDICFPCNKKRTIAYATP